MRPNGKVLAKGSLSILLLVVLLTAWGSPADAAKAPPRIPGKPTSSQGNLDIRVQNAQKAIAVAAANGVSRQAAAARAQAQMQSLVQGTAAFTAAAPSVQVRFSPVIGAPEVVRNPHGGLTVAAPGRPGIDIVREFLHTNKAVYGLSDAEIDALRFKGEASSPKSGARMVRVDQVVNGIPVFQSDTRFLLDRSGRLFRSVGLLVPQASALAPFPAAKLSAAEAFAVAMKSVGIQVDATKVRIVKDVTPGHRGAVAAPETPQIKGSASTQLVYFPLTPGVLVPAWMQVTFTRGEGDYTTLVDAKTGTILWRKNIRSYASTQQARFSVYAQADGAPADSPSPLSPTPATPNFQPPGIARTDVSMLSIQTAASPNGWIPDGGNTTTGPNVDAYLDTDDDDAPDAGLLDNNGRPVGNLDGSGNNRDFLGTGYNYTPPPQGGNPDAGTSPTDTQFQRGAVTHLFYLTNWYHDRLASYGFTPAAGNFEGSDPVLAEVQDGAGTNNANFGTPPDGDSGRMQMFIFDFPTPNRDGSLDAEIVLHELTHGTSNRLIGDSNGLIWDAGGGMGEGWSDFYALSLLNHTNADDPNGKYASGGYATYQLGGLTDNYTYGIRRFPYSTDNTVNPLTWADVDDVTYNEAGGIPSSPLGFGFNGAFEVHNIGEIWANSLWEVRSRVIAASGGDVPTGNDLMLQIVTEALMMTPINPSFEDARDALIDADCAFHGCANEASIWGGFADRGLGYKSVAPLGHVGVIGIGAYEGVGESFSSPYLDFQSVAIDDSLGNNNGAIDPGEAVRLTVTLFNPWRNASRGVASAAATLSTSTPGVTILDNASVYPAIPAQGSAAGDTFLITVPANAACGQSIRFTVATTSTLGAGTASFVVRVGAPSGTAAPVTYTKTPNLAIPDNDFNGVTDTLNITDDREIADVEFRLDSLPHTFTGDLTVALKAPNGYGTDLIYLRGLFIGDGDGDNFTNTTIVEGAPNDLNLSGEADAPYTADWQPAFNGDIWALFGITNLGPDPVGQLASRLVGQGTQGNWQVHVTDQAGLDTGTLSSWSLVVTPRAFTCQGVPVTVAVSGTMTVAGTFTPGGTVTYTVTLTNSGTAAQGDNPGNEFTDTLPPSLTLVNATASSGSAVAGAGNLVTWNGTIAPLGGTVTITITATVNAGVCNTTVSNQGTISYDANADGTNDTTALTDDPAVAGTNNPTNFAVVGACFNVVEVPTLDEVGLAALAILLAGAALFGMRRRRTA